MAQTESSAPRLAYVKRGPGPEDVMLVDERGTVLYAQAYGLTDQERRETRERLLEMLATVVPRR